MSNLIEIDEIIFNLKATITSNKGGVQLNCIESDYYNLIGEPIPYKNLGFNSIVDFLESFKEVFKIKNKGFNKFVYVISGGKTQHLEKMISKQKTKSKRKYKSKSQSVVSNKKLNTSNTYNNSMNYRLRKKKPPVDNSIYPTNKNNSRSSKINDENKLFKKRDEPRVFAQDRLKKYEKKNINQIENKELKNEVTSEDSVLELSKIFTKQCNIRDTVFTKACNIPIQSKQLPEYYNEHINLKINQYTFESKCKKIVTVTAVFSPSSICVVLEDYNINSNLLGMQIEFNKMETGIQTQLNTIPVTGCYYALYHQQKWHRVVVESIYLDNSVKCFLIDIGKSIIVNRHQIYYLDPKFVQICSRAMKAILNKLKLFDEFPFIKEIVIEKLLETKCILIPNSVITDPPTVTLYDLETRMNINDIIINSFYKKVTPEINFGDGYDFAEVKLILVENGYCYVQFNQDLIKSLEKIFSTDQFFGPYLKNARDIDYKNIYLAYYGQNIKGRVKVEYFTSNYQVKVYFIDYGCFKNVEVNTLVDLSRINTYLVRIPSQAFKVALHMFPPEDVTSRTVEELFSILGNNTNVKMYKLKNFMGPIPCVKLWNIAYPDTFINIILYLRLSELNQ
ncbi:uncharacterized protein LOC112591464 isoform X1 [Melanaphis sacchari]|uniref:Tudor domain-containing protein 7 n=1 Tax=Melanaphis sacchari TaxID=742174 RepID=A0A2H8TY43_9HEMI|nr:uncharacterized protein LOC112591464 isoform X1 [Melanaphis sacchari]XP_025191085.1 uncharacterized protein LOC112591464 isoform X1 [Melanaphis sacchari]